MKMRIKQVKINGIRGFYYLEDSPHIIELDGKHLFLYGENGTGKSSFLDAIEWCLTGEVEESKTRRVDKREFLINKFCDKKDAPFVEIIYVHNGQEESFCRKVNSKTKFVFEDLAGDHFIDTKRIENFVIDTKQSLWDRFSTLLGFEDLIEFDRRLRKLKNTAEKKYQEITEKLRQQEKELEGLENRMAELRGKFKDSVEEDLEIKLNEEENRSRSERFKKLQEFIINLDGIIKELEEKMNLDEKLKEYKSKLANAQEMITEVEISEVVNTAYEYFKKTEEVTTCPVCGQPIEYYDVLRRLENLKENLSKIINLKSEIRKINNSIEQKQQSLLETAEKVKNLYFHLYKKELNIEISKEEFDRNLISDLETIKEDVRRESDAINEILRLSQEWGRYKEIKQNSEKSKISKETLETRMKVVKKIYDDICDFYEIYRRKYAERIAKELENISKNEVTLIYNKINQSENEVVDTFIIEPDIGNIEEPKISFRAVIKGTQKVVDALSILSTGHLRCLGFALLVARIKSNPNSLNFIAIDDPIYSIDHEHRYNLITYLRELGSQYQLIITTSDRVFYDIIKHQFNGNSFKPYNTSFGSISNCQNTEVVLSIDIKPCYRSYIEKAEEYSYINEIRAASLYARLALETVLFSLAEKVNLKIPYKRIHKITIKDLMGAKLKEELKNYFQDRSNEIEMEFQKLSHHRYFKSLLNGFPLDEKVHYPHEERSSYTVKEVKEVIETIKNFAQFVESLA